MPVSALSKAPRRRKLDCKMDAEFQEAHEIFEEQLLQFCGPIFIAPSRSAPPSQIIANGTFGLIETPSGRFLVTCFHVYEAYVEAKVAHSDTIMAILLGTGFKARAFEGALIDGDKDIDLAVFRWDNGYLGEKAFLPVRQFPIPRVSVGNLVALQGFPGESRKADDFQGRFGACFFGGLVTAVNERKILVENDGTRNLRSVQTGELLPPLDIGGMSGSPAFTFRDGWKLAGFLREGSTTDGRIFLSHASFLNPDGTLDRSQLTRQ